VNELQNQQSCQTSVTGSAGVKEKFDFNTIQDFDNHIDKSIPNYNILISTILSISDYFITKDTTIYDLGCSTGKLLIDIDYPNLKIGYDNSNLMPKHSNPVHFIEADLNKFFEITNACIVYSIFTMQFLNRDARYNYCETVYNGLNEGGAFILCEKIYQENGLIQEILSFSHYDYKLNHFSAKEIIDKEKDLRYIMKPNTLMQNVELLKKVGFKNISTFWQSYNFVGLIAIK
jgi:tRNA (cmo5U34)-methyltransferase